MSIWKIIVLVLSYGFVMGGTLYTLLESEMEYKKAVTCSYFWPITLPILLGMIVIEFIVKIFSRRK